MKDVAWVGRSDKSVGDNSVISFVFCVWKVLSVLCHSSYGFVAVCFAEFSLGRNNICLPFLNATQFLEGLISTGLPCTQRLQKFSLIFIVF